jgi:hypothetical protein
MVRYLSLYECDFIYRNSKNNNNNYKIYDPAIRVGASRYSHHTLQFSADLCGRYNNTMLPVVVSSVFKNFGLYTL